MPLLNNEIVERVAVLVPRRRHHEHIYPHGDGVGGAGAAIALNTNANDNTNAAASTMNYWGEPSLVLTPAVIITQYYFVGCYLTLAAAGGQSKRFHGEFYMLCVYNQSERNAGNAWDEAATVLTVADGTCFEVDDLVWIVSTGHTDGEIQIVADVTGDVVTVVREASQFGAANTGLRWNHTIDGTTETMYLCERATDPVWTLFDFEYESESARRTARYVWAGTKTMPDCAGLIARILNETDSTNGLEIEVKIIYNHG